MAPLLPTPAVGTRCNRLVEGTLVAYPCTLPQNHATENSGEPCVAVEVQRSVRAWQQWHAQHSADAEHEHRWEPPAPGSNMAQCACGASAVVATTPGGKFVIPVVEDPTMAQGTFRVESTEHPPQVVFEDKHDDGGLTNQPKPTGDEALIDDQMLVIEDMHARREHGLRKYSQTHRPFNGRNTLQDAYEEMLDGALYLRSLLRVRQASRDEMVEAALKPMLDRWMENAANKVENSPEGFCREMAEIAVDRILDAVTVHEDGPA